MDIGKRIELRRKSSEIEREFEWNKWAKEIPALNFKEDWNVRVIPPVGSAIARFLVEKDGGSVSVYLDCYGMLGSCEEPYWEIYPHADGCFRCEMNDTEALLNAISESLQAMKEDLDSIQRKIKFLFLNKLLYYKQIKIQGGKIMSGGHFEYDQYRIGTIKESIQIELDRQGKKRSNIDSYGYFDYDEDDKYPVYSKPIQDIFTRAIKYLEIAEIYANRVDYFLSGDDGEENFIKRLKKELDKVENDSDEEV